MLSASMPRRRATSGISPRLGKDQALIGEAKKRKETSEQLIAILTE